MSERLKTLSSHLRVQKTSNVTKCVHRTLNEDGILVIEFDNASALNAVSPEMRTELLNHIRYATNEIAVKVIILTGRGRSFCSGAELGLLNKSLSDKTTPGHELIQRNMDQLLIPFIKCPKPIIAAINGPCVGLGFIYACFCDIRFTCETAKIKVTLAERGLPAEIGLSAVLKKTMSSGNMFDILFSSRMLPPKELVTMGFIQKVSASKDQLMEDVMNYARNMIKTSSPASLAAMKAQVYGINRPKEWALFMDELRESTELQVRASKHPDFAEGVTSYLEKREPTFQGLQAGQIKDVVLPK